MHPAKIVAATIGSDFYGLPMQIGARPYQPKPTFGSIRRRCEQGRQRIWQLCLGTAEVS